MVSYLNRLSLTICPVLTVTKTCNHGTNILLVLATFCQNLRMLGRLAHVPQLLLMMKKTVILVL